MSLAIQPNAAVYRTAPVEAANNAGPPPSNGAEVKTAVQQMTGDMVARESLPAALPPGAQGAAPSSQANATDVDGMVNTFATQMMVNQVMSQAPPPTTNIDMNSSNQFGGAFADPFGLGNDDAEEEAKEEEAKEEAARGR